MTNADSKPELEFRQRTSTETKGDGEVCFDSWYEDGSSDAYSYITSWVNTNADSYIAVKSNISFAGRDGDACKDGKCLQGQDA